MKFIRELMSYVIIILSIILIRTYVITPVIVSGDSMNPTLENGEVLLLNKLSNDYERFDIVIIDFDNGILKEKLIKRVIGLPGEKIEYISGKLYVNGKYVKDEFESTTYDFTTTGLGEKIPENKYLVLGDNRTNSSDSRMLGLIDKKDIEGSINGRIYPLDKLGKID